MTIITNFLLSVLITLTVLWGCSEEYRMRTITKQEAKDLLSSYVNALKSGDTEKIKSYWSNKSLSRPGFEVMHLWIRGLIHISEWKDFLDSTRYTYQMNELLQQDGYYVSNGNWIKPNNAASEESQPMPFYLVWENNSWRLINPIDILTQNWHRYETDHMVFFYPKEININDHLHEIKLMDEKYQSMSRIMEFSAKAKIEYYKAASPEECGRLLTQPPFNGLAAVTYQDTIRWFQLAVSTTFYNPHEVMHIIALSSGIPYSNSCFSEGLAVAYGGTTFQTAEFAHNYSKNIIDNANYIPIKRLLTMAGSDFLRSNYITYQESGSFIRYLIDTYGIARLKNFISDFDLKGDLDNQAIRVYHVSLDELEQNWQKYLREIELPNIGFSIPETAQLVFSMTDPENDDNGDGDYRYPANENYVKGCFDLTKVQVFKDTDNVYFTIGLQQVIKPVAHRPGGVRFVPMTVIALNKGNEINRQLFKVTNEVKLAEGYDVKINVGFGINISDSFGKIFMSTGDCYHDLANFEANTLTCSLPINLIGAPEDDWKYFVGVGLTNEPTFDFSGLIPVFKNIPALISGGNYDASNPAFIDILLPDHLDQSEVLSDYDLTAGKLATVTMISKSCENF